MFANLFGNRMAPKMGKMSVKTRLTAAFLAILLLPCPAIGWFSYEKAKNQVTEQIMQNANQSVQFANEQINEIMSSGLNGMDYLAKSIHTDMIAGKESPKIRQILDAYQATSSFDSVHFATKSGLMILSPNKEMEQGFDPSTRP